MSGYLQQRTSIVISLAFGLIMLQSCCLLHNLLFDASKSNDCATTPGICLPFTKVDTPPSSWILDSLLPPENNVLVRGQVLPISIYFEAHNNANYVIKFTANKMEYRPFVLKMVHGLGQIDFASRVKWYIRVKGKSENIIVGLYRIEESESCKTIVSTLLKQFQRKYCVKRANQSKRK